MRKKDVLIFLLSCFFVSCVKTIEIDDSLQRRIVVNCLLTESSVQTLSLNYSSSLKDKIYGEVEEAKIILLEKNEIIGEFKKNGYSNWEINFTPKQGSTYDLRIEVPNYPLVTATTTMPQRVKINKNKIGDTGIKKNFSSESNENYFWVFAFEKNKDTLMKNIKIDGKYKLLEDLATNYEKVDDFNIQDYLSSTFEYKPHFIYLRMEPNAEEKNFFVEGDLYSSIIVFRSVSGEYDKYLKSSIQKMLVYRSFDDPTQWLDENEIYTNITNGVGIFGAYIDSFFNYNVSLPDE